MQALWISLRALVFGTLLTGLLYPLLVLAIGQFVFSRQANGSLVEVDGKVLALEWIGQAETRPGYFFPRPSATAPQSYNAEASSGSNWGPLAPELKKAMEERRAMFSKMNPGQEIPLDLLTSSASGLDPHISPEAAVFQVPRVARERRVPEETVRNLVARMTEPRQLGFLGEPRVNVGELNRALDSLR